MIRNLIRPEKLLRNGLLNSRLSNTPDYSVFLNKALLYLQEKPEVIESDAGTTVADHVFTPYGLSLGTSRKQIEKEFCKCNNVSSVDLSINLNCLYEVYFSEIQIERLCLVVQFHLINNQLFFVRTDFKTPVWQKEYERILILLIPNHSNAIRYQGTGPYCVSDKVDNKICIHNPKGYPSVCYVKVDFDALLGKVTNFSTLSAACFT